MKKTPAQPQIRATKKIKIPESLSRSQRKANIEHRFFNTLEQPPIITKKELLFQAMGIQVSNKRLIQNRRGQISFREPQKNVQIKIVKQFQALSQDKTFKKSASVEKFKIKMSGAGFRKRGKSVSSIRQPLKNDKTNTQLKPGTSLQTYRSDETDQLDIIKAYYSAHVQFERTPSKIKNKGEQISQFHQYQSQFLPLQTPPKQFIPPKHLTPSIQTPKNPTHPFVIPPKINLDNHLNKKIVKNILAQAFTISDIQTQQQQLNKYEQKFRNRGFGVNHDLAQYDIFSLGDPDGIEFIGKYLNKNAQCPYFQNQNYKWVNVLVVGYDVKSKKAVIIKQGQKKQRMVSRLSIKFKDENKVYWERINQAKALRDSFRKQAKYLGYLDHRPERYDIFQFLLSDRMKFSEQKITQGQFQNLKLSTLIGNFPQHKLKQIQNECHNRYYKNFIIYSQMFKNYQPFQKLGIDYRQLNEQKKIKLYPRYTDFTKNKNILQIQHYCTVTKLAQTLKKMISKILLQTQYSFFHTIIIENNCTDLDNFVKNCKNAITLCVTKLIKQTRQVLVSQIIYQMRYSFGAQERPVLKVVKGNDRELEKKYFRLCNIMFRDLISINYFQQNYETLCSYLTKFTTWTSERPNPIITLTIKITQKTKQFQCIPSQQQSYKKLYSILQFLEKKINTVPDLTDDLLYQKQKFIKVQLKDDAYLRIKFIVDHSYQLISQYLECNTKYLKYLSNITFNRQNFNKNAIKIYWQKLTEMSRDLQKVLHYSLNNSSIFKISLQHSKSTLSQSIHNNRNRIMRIIQKQAIQQNQNMIKQLQKMSQQIKIVPNQEISYVAMKKYVHVDCQNLLDQCRECYQLCGEFYGLLEEFCYGVRVKDFQKFMESTLEIVRMQRKLAIKKQQLIQIQKRLIQKINLERQQIQKIIQAAKIDIEDIINFKKLQDYRTNFTQTSKLYYNLQQNCKKLQNINYRQQLLQQQLSVFPWLNRLMRRLQPFYQMWKNIYHYMIDSQDWYQLPIQELKFEDIKVKVNQVYKKEFGRLSKFFNDAKNTDALMICQAGNQLVSKIQERFWIIDSFTKEGLLKKPNMMSSILAQVYGPEAPDNFRNVNLHDLIDHNAQTNKDFIIKVSTRAQKIWNLQKRINTIIQQIKLHYFELKQKYGLPYIQHQLLLLLSMSTKQQLYLMDVIKSQDQAVDIIKRINNVYNKIQTIQGTLQVIDSFQRVFVRIYRVFLVGEVSSQLPDQKRKINQVSRAWNTITKHFSKDLQVWQAIDSDSHKYRLETCMKTLAEVEESLKKFLQQKRKVFPRLFFLSDDQLLQLIANENISIPTPLLQYLFNGAFKFITKSQNQGKKITIIGLQGPYNDKVSFRKGVNNGIIIWDKLKNIHEQMKESMERQCTMIGLQNSKILIVQTFNKILKWTFKIEQFLRKADRDKNSFTKFSAQYFKEQTNQQTPSYRIGQIQKLYNWYSLKSVGLLLAQFIENMSKLEQNLTPTSFQWQKYVRIYGQSQKIMIKTMSLTLPLNYEYVGCEIQDLINLFSSPLRNLHTVLTLTRIYMGCNSPKNCQQTIKSLSMLTLTHYTQKIVHNQTGMQQFGNIMRGFYVQPFFGCLRAKNYQILLPEYMSILAEIVYQVRQALILRENVTILGTQVKWNHTVGIYNFGLNISIPFSSKSDHHLSTLALCFREVGLSTLPWNIFMKCMLSSMVSDSDGDDVLRSVFGVFEELMMEHTAYFEDNYRICVKQLFEERVLECSNKQEMNFVLNNQEFVLRLLHKVQKITKVQIYHKFQQKFEHILHPQQQHFPITHQYKPQQLQTQINQFIQFLSHHTQKTPYQQNTPKMLAIVGPVQSGKTYLINQALKRLDIPKQQIIQCQSLTSYLASYSTTQLTPKYLILQQLYTNSSYADISTTYHTQIHNLPTNITLLFECRSIQNIGVSPISLYNKKLNNNWHRVMWKLLKNSLSAYSAVIQEFSRQMGIFVRIVLYQVLGCSGRWFMADTWMWEKNGVVQEEGEGGDVAGIWRIQSIFIKIVRNWVRVVSCLVLQGRIIQSQLVSIREGIFLALIWIAKEDIENFLKIGRQKQQKNQRKQFSQSKLLQLTTPNPITTFLQTYMHEIESTLLTKNTQNQDATTTTTVSIKKYNTIPNPYDFCYDIEKKAWLEWSVVDEVNCYFQKFYFNYQEIYLPVKETMAMLYFCQYVSRYWDFWLVAQERGSGSSNLIRKVIYNRDRIQTKKKTNNQPTTTPTLQPPKTQQRSKTQPPKSAKPTITPTLTLLEHYSILSCSANLINKMLEKMYTSCSKDGSLNPYRGCMLYVVVDDMGMVLDQDQGDGWLKSKQQILRLLTSLTINRKRIHTNSKLNNLRLTYITNNSTHKPPSSSPKNCYIDRLTSSTIPIHMPPITSQSKTTIFNYILQWFFQNTDNPFSKQVRSMQGILVGLAVHLAGSYQILGKKYIGESRLVRGEDYNTLGRLRNVFDFVCRVNPRKVKKQKDILDIWIYQFSTLYPGLSWVDYLHVYQQLNIKNPPISTQQLIASFQQHIPKPNTTPSQSPSQYMLKLSTTNNRPQQYNTYSYKQAQQLIINKLLTYTTTIKQATNFINQLIFYPQFVGELVQLMRVFVGGRMNLMRVCVPYSGVKTALCCGMLVAVGHYQLGVVQQGSKTGWRKDIMQYLAKRFKQYTQTNTTQPTNNQSCLVFNLKHYPYHPQYLETLSEYLQHKQSKRMLYIQSLKTQENINDEQQKKQPTTLMEYMEIHSCFSEKYGKFVKFCQGFLRIVVMVRAGDVENVIRDAPGIVKYCQLIQMSPTFINVEGIVNRSLGVTWTNDQILHSIKNQTYDLLNQKSKTILKNIIQIQEQILKNYNIFSNRKQGIIQWMRSSISYYKNMKNKYEELIGYLKSLLSKKEEIQVEKEKLEKELSLMLPKYGKVKLKNQGILAEVLQQQSVYLNKKDIYDRQAEIVQMKRKKTNDIQRECEQQLGKVTPMLASAEESLQKVTRDDINQLRSFPNPPLSAVKVVEALCFVFNEDNLVKQKVENGNKFKDYWDYAKKFILNDRLLKRVTQFKPDYIKNMNKNKMQILKVLIRQPQFKQQRVFKASSAAGNLSVWMRAVVLTFQVMQVIDPKRKLLNQTIQALQQAQQILAQMKADMQKQHVQYTRRQKIYNDQMQIQNDMLNKINHCKNIIKRSQDFLTLLSKMEVKWNKDIQESIPEKIQKAKQDSVFVGLYFTYLAKVGYSVRKEIKEKIEKIFSGMKGFVLSQSQMVGDYYPIFLKRQQKQVSLKQSNSSKQAIKTENGFQQELPKPQTQIQKEEVIYLNIISNYYCENVISLFQKFNSSEKNLIVFDQTSTFTRLLCENIQRCNKTRCYRIINCIQFQNQEQIYQQLTKQKKDMDEDQDEQSEVKISNKSLYKYCKELVIIQNLDQLSIWNKFIQYLDGQFEKIRVVVIFNRLPISAQLFTELDIKNQLCLQTKQSCVSSIICPITKQPTQLSTKHQQYSHKNKIEQHFNNMTKILLKSSNILLDDNAITEWVNNYEQYWKNQGVKVQVKQNGQIQREVVKMLADSGYWEEFVDFGDFLGIVARADKDNIYSLNQKLKEKFENGGKKPQGTELHKKILRRQSDINQLTASQIPKQQQPILPFTPFKFVQIDVESSKNLIAQFLEWKKENAPVATRALANTDQVFYFPSHQKALENLPFCTENQKEIVVCCRTKFQAYKLYEKIRMYYENFCTKMEDTDDEFTQQKYGFRVDILITNQKNMMKNKKWRVTKWQNNKKSNKESDDNKYIVREFRNTCSTLIKAQKTYCEQLITRKNANLYSITFSEFAKTFEVDQKDREKLYEKWEKLQLR